MNRRDSKRTSDRHDNQDPVLQMIGVGRDIWQDESGDELIERLRADWPDEDLDSPASGADREARGPVA